MFKKPVKKPGVVANACNPSTWEAEMWESRGWGQPGLQSETPSQKKQNLSRLGGWICHYYLGSDDRRIQVRDQTGKS
jgi:hypothetical protein